MRRVLLGFLILAPAGALADDLCRNEVFDDANLFDAADSGRIMPAVREVQAQTGAMVRVRIFRNYDGRGNLDRAYEQLERLCSEYWRGADGIRLPHLLVFLITTEAPERDLGFFYGSRWKRALDAEGGRILDEITVPRFQSGDIAGGITATFDELGRVLIAAPSAGTAVSSSGPPPDLSGLWYFLGGIVLLFAVVVIDIMLYRAAGERRKRREADKKARESARILSEELIGLVLEVPRLIRSLEEKLGELVGKVADSELSGIRESVRDAESAKQSAIEPYNSIRLSADAALSRDDVSVGECEAFVQSFKDIRARFERAKHYIAEGNKLADEILRAVREAPGLMRRAESAAEEAGTSILRQKEAGFKMEKAEAMLGEARAVCIALYRG